MDSSTKASVKSRGKTKAAELERVRNNQRRSRARRRDYIEELEERIREFECSASQSVDNPAVQRLSRENDLLKRLLASLGLGNDFLKSYTKASEKSSELSGTTVRPSDSHAQDERHSSAEGIQPDPTPNATFPVTPSQLVTAEYRKIVDFPSLGTLDIQQSPIPSDDSLWGFSLTDDHLKETAEIIQSPTQPTAHGIPTLLMDDLQATEVSENAIPLDNTTLCSLAFSLVMVNNRKGYSTTELDIRLRAGYRPGSEPSDGCRIENKVLFSVLAEIL
ncbi:hypothetical protein BDV95DRAFT_585297 [Massariosphaeria phaeospora]|uniref:BZIP domain-containing protein n=1 Tax=Massariosphaeria phaeospora TaxID=100035 RepID=A0A7C8HZ61_9PLEO|nr:hypothetical protein BDV95DRAFT_585297 [Massariosphaeria phaeospora]